MSAAQADLQREQKLYDENKRIAARLVDAEQNYETAKLELGNLETSVATYQYVPTLLKQLEELGTSMDLHVLSVRPQPAEAAPVPIKKTAEESKEGGQDASKTASATASAKKEAVKPYEELKIDIEVEGSYWRTRNFIFMLTKFPKIVSVNEVQMSPAGVIQRKGSPNLQVRLNVTAFVFSDKQQANDKAKGSSADTSASAVGLDRRSNDEG
jgi:Tfp pilus assembly protein PilO